MVLGASGFVGSTVMRLLRARGEDAVAVARTSGSSPDSHVVAADLGVPCALQNLLDAVRPKKILNCAAVADFTAAGTKEMFAVNSLAPALLGAWAAESDAYLVQVSATIVCGLRTELYTDRTPTNPDTAYGKTKLAAEGMIELSGARALLVRVGGIVGAEGPDHNSVNRALREARSGSLPKIVGRGSAIRNYIHVDSFAKMLIHFLDTECTGTVLVGGSELLSVAEILRTITDVWLPRQSPRHVLGSEATDQVVRPTPGLPATESFREALQREKERLSTRAVRRTGPTAS